MMPDLSITRIAVSLIEAARRQGLLSLSSIVPPILLTINHSTTISSDESNARALPFSGRGVPWQEAAFHLGFGQEQVHPSCGLAIRVSAVCGAKPTMRQRETPPQQASLTKGLRKDTKHVGNENSNQIQFTIINH